MLRLGAATQEDLVALKEKRQYRCNVLPAQCISTMTMHHLLCPCLLGILRQIYSFQCRCYHVPSRHHATSSPECSRVRSGESSNNANPRPHLRVLLGAAGIRRCSLRCRENILSPVCLFCREQFTNGSLRLIVVCRRFPAVETFNDFNKEILQRRTEHV